MKTLARILAATNLSVPARCAVERGFRIALNRVRYTRVPAQASEGEQGA